MIYKILWIEDDVDWLDSMNLSQIKKHLGEYGFKADFEFRSSEEEINMDVDGMAYDLIVIDYNITNDGKSGSEVIGSVRESQCFTDVIFYSARSITELRLEALDKGLDGVFFSTRENDSLLWKICQLFDLNVKHLMSISNVRGLVMSGVADLDLRLLSLISEVNEGINDDLKFSFRQKIVTKLAPNYNDIKKFFISVDEDFRVSFKGLLKQCGGFEPNVFENLIENRAFSSFKRVESIETLCKYKKVETEYKELIVNIKTLLNWRNALAHQIPEERNGTLYFKIGDNSLPFDGEQSKIILNQLRDLEVNLNDFSKVITGKV